MKLESVGQTKLADLQEIDPDLVICASGYEARARSFARRLGRVGARRIAVGFQEERANEERVRNDAALRELNFDSVVRQGDDDNAVADILSDELEKLGGASATITVDISSMTRTWYGGAINAVRFASFPQEQVRLVFAYTPAAFVPIRHRYPQNRYVGPVRGFTGLELPTKATALVVGLGQDTGRALGVHGEVDPGAVASFLASPGTDRRYEAAVQQANSEFLELVPKELQFRYPILEFPLLVLRLRDVCDAFTGDWHPVLVALGPKIFSLSCFLVATQVDGISVWRVSAGKRQKPINRRPGRSLVLAVTSWGRDD